MCEQNKTLTKRNRWNSSKTKSTVRADQTGRPGAENEDVCGVAAIMKRLEAEGVHVADVLSLSLTSFTSTTSSSSSSSSFFLHRLPLQSLSLSFFTFSVLQWRRDWNVNSRRPLVLSLSFSLSLPLSLSLLLADASTVADWRKVGRAKK